MRSTNVKLSSVLFIVAIFLLGTLSSVHALPALGIAENLYPFNKHYDKKELTHATQVQHKKTHDHGEKTQVQKRKTTIHNNDGGATFLENNINTKETSTKSPTPFSKIGSPCPPGMKPSGNICMPHHPFFGGH